jgi:formylglycine-generating enzyme required for sulfatase activity
MPDRREVVKELPDRRKVVKEWPREITNSIGMELVRIPAGTFTMGSPEGEEGRGASEMQHEVEITRPFWLGKYEVTQAQWREVMGDNPSWFSSGGGGRAAVQGKSTDAFPVDSVSWHEVQTFLTALSARAQEKDNGRAYRLPSEAEWEYACRGGSATYQVFHYGNSLSSFQANFNGNEPYGGAPRGPQLLRTRQVGRYKPNAFGLYDMHGNALEWCQDWYDPVYYGRSPRKDPVNTVPGTSRVIRSGAREGGGRFARSAGRWRDLPSARNPFLSFRAALVPATR